MPNVLKVSNAASMGLHAAVLLAAHPRRLLSNHEIAATIGVSEAHLSKVLQRLTRAGLVTATRGPGGGFGLRDRADRITLLQVYEAIEGPLETNDCLLQTPICGGKACILGNLLPRLNRDVRKYLAKTRLSSVTDVYEKSP